MPDDQATVPGEKGAHHTGVSQEYAGGWRWVCSCGAESRKAVDRDLAQERATQHERRKASDG